ncbi:deoxyhypusine synthase isoform X3 [Ochotona curzoniae]|uniref:deoxyhypusine synthase isoform X3 n=1 Tax=Ochotona curzoniae TaxID=130825 RepID=UPI001B352DEB|nr:deoxyhypusine synthase isoform X3 [Ochotona curzoniae]
MEGGGEGEAPAAALAAVLKHSSALPPDSAQVHGYDFDRGVDYRALLQAFGTTGFQATNFGRAVQQVNAMIEKKLEPLPQDEDQHADLTRSRRPLTGCTIFLGYTSNLISSGVRETIRYLVQHNMVDVLVTTAGGVEEDLIKCLAPTYLGEFSLRGKELRENGINRIGNLLVPNDNYCKFEDWLMPILDQMVLEQNTEGVKWTPSKMIARLGKEINSPESVYYWAQKPGAHGWLAGRHDLLPFLQEAGPGPGHRGRPAPHQHAGHLRQTHRDDHPGRGPGQAPHCQRQPDAQRGRLLRLHQHGPRV